MIEFDVMLEPRSPGTNISLPCREEVAACSCQLVLGEDMAVWLVVNNHGVHLVVRRGDHGDLGQLMVGGGGGVAVH